MDEPLPLGELCRLILALEVKPFGIGESVGTLLLLLIVFIGGVLTCNLFHFIVVIVAFYFHLRFLSIHSASVITKTHFVGQVAVSELGCLGSEARAVCDIEGRWFRDHGFRSSISLLFGVGCCCRGITAGTGRGPKEGI